MHIADGIVSTEAVLAADAVTVGVLYLFGRKVEVSEVPKMGFMAAALFVASLIHFPMAGTSLHLGLFGLAGIILGLRAFPAVFAALFFQALIFQHGGLLSVGLNTLNMGAGALLGFFIWKLSAVPESLRALAAGFLGIMLPAFLLTMEFQLSGYGRSVFFILSIYLIAAAAEGILTLVVVGFFRKVEPSVLG
ncbi:MAG: energy-coupling factor ABC transporter permease [Candidatus Aminicenantes bacterium]|nr:energy-coupling factor ABC transporter permease [Candidatus Aminicenantes bacterium]